MMITIPLTVVMKRGVERSLSIEHAVSLPSGGLRSSLISFRRAYAPMLPYSCILIEIERCVSVLQRFSVPGVPAPL